MNQRLATFLFALGLVLAAYLPAPAQTETANGVRAALKAGNPHELARHFNSNIELIIEVENVEMDKVSSTQAELILKSFFGKYPVKAFDYMHQGASPEGARYCTGTYQSANGSFLVYILMKAVGGRYVVDTIHFRQE